MSPRIPRLEMNQLAQNVQDVLGPRVKRLGYLGEFFKCSGHQPDVLAPFMEMTEALKVALPDRLTETGALTIAVVMRNRYERVQHERLSEKLGFGKDWVAAVLALEPDAPGPMSEAERAVQRLALAVIDRNGHDVEDELESVIDQIGHEQAIAILFLIGRYATHAFIVNALELAPPVQSIFGEKVA